MGTVFISEKANPVLIKMIEDEGHTIYKVKATDLVYDAIASHPDIYMCRIKETLLIDEAAVTDPPLLAALDDDGSAVTEGGSATPGDYAGIPDGIFFQMGGIGHDYPDDVPYNAVSTDRFFIHNTDLTSPDLLDSARFAGLQIINVKQGYTKCSCAVVGDHAIITSDEGIAKTIAAYNEAIKEELAATESYDSSESGVTGGNASATGAVGATAATADRTVDGDAAGGLIDLLLIRKGHIELPGMEYGFIGGTCGQIGKKIFFNGNLRDHPDFHDICRFIEDHGFTPVWCAGAPLTDIGSIICI